MTETLPLAIRLFESMLSNHVLVKPDTPIYTIVAATQGYIQVVEIPKKNLIGKGIFENFPSNPDDPNDTGERDLQDLFKRVIHQKKPFAAPVQRYDTANANGVYIERYWKTVVVPVLDAYDEVEFLVQTVEEITDKVITEKLQKEHQTLTAANQYLQSIVDLVQAPLQVLEPILENGKIVDFRYKLTNAAYSAYANTTPEKLYNRRVGDVFPGYFQTNSFTNIVEVFETGVANEWEIHYDQDGLDIYNKMNATRMDGEVVVAFTEITALKNLQIELEKKVAELERSNESLEAFAHAASHDLKEPVRKIHFFTQQLRSQLEGCLGDSERKTFEKVELAADRMARLIDDLLVYSHVSQHPVENEPVDLNKKVQIVLEDLELDIQEKKATVNVGQLPIVYGFKRGLQQVFHNLISNSLKYSKGDELPHISITAEKTNKNSRPFHLITVEDNGIGFEQEHSNKIFQLFTRLHGKNEFSGTGVGLSIVKKVVENHQGFIEVKSTPGKGSTFKVYLPAE